MFRWIPWWRGASRLCVLTVLAGCGGGEDGATAPGPGPDLRGRALEAGLAALPATPVYPPENPFRAEKAALGHLLFFDPVLSGPMDVACSTCHLPRLAFTDGRQFPSGAGGSGLGPERTSPGPPPLREMPRNSPPVFNVGLYGRGSSMPASNGTMFWSGSAFGLEDQVLNPIAADNELRGVTYGKPAAVDSVLARLRSLPRYVELFAAAFPEEAALAEGDPDRLVTHTTLRLALAAYVRELVTPDAPLDRFLRGDDAALSDLQRRGLELFVGEAGCVGCHTGPLLSDFSMHVIGGAQDGLGRDTTPGDDLGWGEHGGTPYSFRTPPLRQVSLTPPYLHAGTAATLRAVLDFKNRGVSEHPNVSDAQLDPLVRPLGLPGGELDALHAFLEALTDPLTGAGPLFEPPAEVPSGLEIPR
ncbi:MAG: cytochrome c peroxidase [Longimicrobiales bacterium]|nr:cytochrome c peroxidase [Longimicrobiales bacterium]